MNRKRKKILILIMICISALLIAGLLIMPRIQTHMQLQREMLAEMEKIEKERVEQERIAMSYVKVNRAFGMRGIISTDWRSYHEYGTLSWFALEDGGMYLPLPEPNVNGVRVGIYLRLRLYENRTGIYLPYDKVVDFFSEKYEPDGSLRLYDNGKHPEIEAYVDWSWELNTEDLEGLSSRIDRIYAVYIANHSVRNGGEFIYVCISDMSPQMLAALARKEADPDYELDLTSLQQQGY